MEPEVLLETARLRFRRHQPSDEGDFLRSQMDAESRRYVGGDPRTLEEAIRRFRSNLQKQNGLLGRWAVVLKNGGQYIGYCALLEAGDGVHLGYYIDKQYWRQGFGYEAALSAVEMAVANNFAPIRAEVEKGNVASERILQKLGFARVREEYLAYSDRLLIHYELLATGKG